MAKQPRRRFSWLAFFTSAAILGFLAFELVFSVRPMREVFIDFKLRLPAPTQIVLTTDDLFRSGGWVAFVAAPVLIGVLAPQLNKSNRVRTSEDYARILNRLIAAMIVGLSIMAIIVLLHVAMNLPMTNLIEGISGRQR